ncbi:MAG: HAD-IC family P-type ATPase [Candidatus Omnitrophica bacterium]|nr:HAD-IC family P-type ATPase [Candidatus Omnitrophota bacterium]
MDTKTPYNLAIENVVQTFQTNVDQGLSQNEVQGRLSKHGRNIFPQAKEPGLISIFLQQFLSPLIYILLVAAGVALYFKEWHDALFIFIVLVANAAIGSFQEYSAQKSAQALRKLISVQAKVVRDGKNLKIDAEELVPGDIVLLESGDKVPADLRLISSQGLEIDESLLTGESTAVSKQADIVLDPQTSLGDRKNMTFLGTLVTRGRGKGIVVATGLSTQLGELASSLLTGKEGKPPLLIRMERLTRSIAIFIAVAIILLFVLQWLRGVPLKEIFLSSIALAVSAIPEGLPIAITVALAVGMRRMAKRQVIIRKLLAVESLGSCTFIASDKTGTLTMNELSVVRIRMPWEKEWMVTGVGTVPDGKITDQEQPLNPEQQKLLQWIAQTVSICNEAELTHSDGKWASSGDSVDVSLLVLSHKAGLPPDDIKKNHPQVATIPYESQEQFAAVLYQTEQKQEVAVKGAMEKLLTMCDKMATTQGEVPIDVKLIEDHAHHLAEQGFRVLATAGGTISTEGKNFDKQSLHHLTFLGLIGMIDPLRPEAKEAVKSCQKAGIQVAMVTGDHPVTALAISRELQLADDMSQVVTGKQIEEAKNKESNALDLLTKNARVFARVEPQQKLFIVESLSRQGHFVAVTGDGANDAPALRAAHVGVAMGKRGTDVARESAQLILADDNFTSIVGGIEEGRVAYANVRKVIFLVISTGAAEIIIFALAVFTNLPLPLLPTQLLWLNLVTNGIQDVSLAFEPAEGDELKKPPRSPQERIFDPLMIKRIFLSATVMSVVSFLHYRHLLDIGWTTEAARNSVLLLMVLFQNVHVMNCRSEVKSFLNQNPLRNRILFFGTISAQLLHIIAMYTPGLKDILHIEPVSLGHWAQLLSMALLVLIVIEFHKFISRRSQRKNEPKSAQNK